MHPVCVGRAIFGVVAIYGLLLNLLLSSVSASGITIKAFAGNGSVAQHVLCLSDQASQPADPSGETDRPGICQICAMVALVMLPAAPPAVAGPVAIDAETRLSVTHVVARIAVAGPRNRGPPSA